jgi:hypothetical protein
MTIKLFSKLFGYEYDMVKKQPTASRQKIVTLGSLMLIPVMLWMVSGFYISRVLMECGLMTSMFVSLILGIIICIVDRSFISTPKMKGGYLLLGYRLVFALITTVLGTLALDLMIFAGDLEEYRTAHQEDAFQEIKAGFIAGKQGSLEELRATWQREKQQEAQYATSYIKEMEGTGGTGTYGRGKVAAAKEKLALESGLEAERIRGLLQQAEKELEQEAELYAAKITAKPSGAILSQIEDLHAYLVSRPIGELVYWVFFLFVFFLEAAFVLFKFSASKSLFEDMLLAEEEIGKFRLEQLKQRRREIIGEDGLMGVGADALRKLGGDHKVRRII